MTWTRCSCKTSGINLQPGDPDAWTGAIHTPDGDVIGVHHANRPCEPGGGGAEAVAPAKVDTAEMRHIADLEEHFTHRTSAGLLRVAADRLDYLEARQP